MNELELKNSTSISQAVAVITRHYNIRKSTNPRYSLRAFARDLNISQTLLSLILNGKRRISLPLIHKFSASLKLTQSDQQILLSELKQPGHWSNASIDFVSQASEYVFSKLKRFKLSSNQFNLISNWHHFALLDLTTTHDFISSERFIAARLGISFNEAKTSIRILKDLGLLRENNGVLRKINQHIAIYPHALNSKAIQNFHLQMTTKIRSLLKDTAPKSKNIRSITSNSLAFESSRLEEAKAFISEFENEFIKRFTNGNVNEVYQLGINFIPLTRSKKTEEFN